MTLAELRQALDELEERVDTLRAVALSSGPDGPARATTRRNSSPDAGRSKQARLVLSAMTESFVAPNFASKARRAAR